MHWFQTATVGISIQRELGLTDSRLLPDVERFVG